jgi:orotidine-5'-phosphate decarboxylase
MKEKGIIVALDFADKAMALDLVDKMDPAKCYLKVGNEMFTRFGPSFITTLIVKGFKIFLDLKFHDIPNTVANAVMAAADLGVWMLNVHTLAGKRVMEAASEALDKISSDRPLLIGVTVLTSHSQEDLTEIGIDFDVKTLVLCLATLAHRAGLKGVVCSAEEAKMLRQNFGEDFVLVTPGIRLKTSPADDQKRIVSPEQAFANGADYLVVGRPITQAKDPMTVVEQILQAKRHK